MKMACLRHSFRALLFLIAGFLAASATPAAACTFGGDYASGVDFGNVNVARDVGAGGQVSVVTRTVTWDCPAKTARISVVNVTPTAADAASGKYNYGAFGPAGTGVTVDLEAPTPGTKIEMSNSSRGYYWLPTDPSKRWTGSVTLVWRLWKTDVMSVQIPSSKAPVTSFDETSKFMFTANGKQARVGNVSAQFYVPVCSTGDQTVKLPKLRMSELETRDTAGATPFDIVLSCPGGAPVRVFMTLTDPVNRANRSNMLTPAGGTTAEDVSVQILDPEGSPVLLGEATKNPGNPGSWQVGSMGDTRGGFRIPLRAQYIRRKTGPMTPGTVRGLLEFTLSYQ